MREQIFANQKKLGVIPPDAKLTPWPKDLLKEWDQHTPEEKKLLIRQADVYAAYLAYADHEIGRVVQTVQDLGKLDNTIIIFISGDNGASAEGSLMGTWNEMLPFNGINPTAAENMPFYDAWGNDQTYPHYAVGWAWTFDTPFKWNKQIASFFGGTKNGMVISWPERIKDKGGIRWQFHHVIDIVPTLLEITGIPAPVQVDGVAQKPIEGVSLGYTFGKDAGGSEEARGGGGEGGFRQVGKAGRIDRVNDRGCTPARKTACDPGDDWCSLFTAMHLFDEGSARSFGQAVSPDHHRQLRGRQRRQSLDPPGRRRHRQAVADRQGRVAAEHADRAVLQRRDARRRTRLAAALPVSVPLSPLSSMQIS